MTPTYLHDSHSRLRMREIDATPHRAARAISLTARNPLIKVHTPSNFLGKS
jgi:hypothetical protein